MTHAQQMEAKQAVRERDGHKCVDCGQPDSTKTRRTLLHVHRLVPGSVYTVEGCVLVCIPCHRKRHHKPKRGSVRVNTRIARLLGIIALANDVAVADLLDYYLAPIVEREFPKALKTVQGWDAKIDGLEE